MTNYSADMIAKWFIERNYLQLGESDADPLTNLKLQKLLYYAQGCYLAIYDAPLFSDEICAWTYGPAVPSVYDTYKKYRFDGIPYEDEAAKLDDDTENILEQVYEIFGQYSAYGLMKKTHCEAPWQDTPQTQEISQTIIKEYFKTHYVKEENKQKGETYMRRVFNTKAYVLYAVACIVSAIYGWLAENFAEPFSTALGIFAIAYIVIGIMDWLNGEGIRMPLKRHFSGTTAIEPDVPEASKDYIPNEYLVPGIVLLVIAIAVGMLA